MADSMPMVTPALRPRSVALSRLFDVTVAGAALLLLLPVVLVVSLAILVESGRPILFRQKRLGHNGHPFVILKFKKFRDAHDGSGPPLTSQADARMTRIGAILQRTKLDEVPQFLNVLAGDMAIVGPRPESLRLADGFTGRFRPVLSHKPGIFGPNQVMFRHEDALFAGRHDVEGYYRHILFPLKASVDVIYFSKRTMARDMRLLLSGVAAICFGTTRTEHLILGSDPVRSFAGPASDDVLPPAIDLSLKA